MRLAATSFCSSRHFAAAASVSRAQEAKDVLLRAQAVCFDVDSTVITEEGIDVLADFTGSGEEVARLTAAAMGGSVKFEDALDARLNIIKPSKRAIASCIEERPFELSPGVAGLVNALQARGTSVYLVSGGFRLMIEPIARTLDIPEENIFANSIHFDDNGDYAGFDSNEFTSCDGGKPRTVAHLKERHGYDPVVMVGDGATDMQAKAPGSADAFIGFGGVAVRSAVKDGADWFVTDFEEMTAIVKRSNHPFS
jgi:phosphoserine phosphatase